MLRSEIGCAVTPQGVGKLWPRGVPSPELEVRVGDACPHVSACREHWLWPQQGLARRGAQAAGQGLQERRALAPETRWGLSYRCTAGL